MQKIIALLCLFCAAAGVSAQDEQAVRSHQVPVFLPDSVIQFGDSRGQINVFAVARDASVWHLVQPRDGGPCSVEQLAGEAAGAPSISFTSDGLLQVWIVSPAHALFTNIQNSTRDGWSGWKRIEAPRAEEVTASFHPGRGTVVLLRDMRGQLLLRLP